MQESCRNALSSKCFSFFDGLMNNVIRIEVFLMIAIDVWSKNVYDYLLENKVSEL